MDADETCGFFGTKKRKVRMFSTSKGKVWRLLDSGELTAGWSAENAFKSFECKAVADQAQAALAKARGES
jgi:hypothetical protein